MANIGEQLLQPESGMKRISCTNYSFKYNNDWNIDSEDGISSLQTLTQNSKVTVYLYTSKVYLLTERVANRGALNIYINDVLKSNISLDNGGTYYKHNVVAYAEEFTEKQIIKLEFENSTSNKWVVIENIDIDEDGYMIYCDDNGKLYYDMTPIMTSNTTPDGYEVSASSSYISNIEYKAFDGTIIEYADGNDGWVTYNPIYSGWLNLKSSNKISINSFIIYTRYNIPLQAPKNFKILGSNDGQNYDVIAEYSNITDWVDYKLFKLDKIYCYKNYKIEVDNNDIAVGVGELRYLLAVDTPFYLIKDNSNNKVYNYDEENNQLIEVTNISILKENALYNTCICNLNRVIPLLNSLSNDLTLLCNNNSNVVINGIKSNKQLITAKSYFSTRLAKNIDYFELMSNTLGNSNIKMVVSIDEGLTWKTYKDGWVDLTNTISLKEYSNLTDEEKIQLNNFIDEINVNGIDSSILNTIDFNLIKSDSMMFAYVINREDYLNDCTMSKLQYQFDAHGNYKLLTTEVEIGQSIDSITVKPSKDIELMKINVGSSGNITISSGTGELEFANSEDINSILSKGWDL